MQNLEDNMGEDISAKLDEILEKLNSSAEIVFTKTLTVSKNGNSDDVIYSTFNCPNGYEISKVIYTTTGFSTDMYYYISISDSSVLDGQNRENVNNRNLDLSSLLEKESITLYIRRYGESGGGTASVSCNITISKI